MKQFNIRNIPVAANVCQQVLREVERNHQWSLAHVTMNPMASSLLHSHRQMTEVYVITKGYGELSLVAPQQGSLCHPVVAGSVFEIPAGIPHMLENRSAGHLEHLVFAVPPFDPNDVYLLGEKYLFSQAYALHLPKAQDCFDGAKMLAYNFSRLGLSIAFGWVMNNPTRLKRPHYHKNTTEWVYVVEGEGFVEIDRECQTIKFGDWIQINPDTEHALLNGWPEDLVVMCVCSPAFQMEDVYYRD